MKPCFYIICATFIYSASARAETQFSITPSLLLFDHTEYGFNDSVLNNESGTIPGVQLSLNTTTNKQLAIELEITGYDGDVNYDGHTQSGIPITTTTDENVLRYGVRISTALFDDTDIFLSTTHHQWKRDIQGKGATPGIFEKYQWHEISAGLKTKFLEKEQSSWSAEAAILKTINPEMYIDLTEADLGSTNLNLGTNTGMRFKISCITTNTSNQSYGFSVFYETWDFGISDSKTTSGGSSNVSIYEPRSETRHSGIQFRIRYNL